MSETPSDTNDASGENGDANVAKKATIPAVDRAKSGERPQTDFNWYPAGMFLVGGSLHQFYGIRGIDMNRVPESGGVLLVANHNSFLDIPAIARTNKRPVTFVARENLVDIPILGRWIRHWGPILLRRGTADVSALKESVAALRAGSLVCLFPEGTRSRDGNLQTLRPGVVMVARRAGVPVVAAGIAGTYEVLPRQRKIPRLRGTFVVSYSEPFHLDHSAGEESNLDRIRREILGQMARARELWRS